MTRINLLPWREERRRRKQQLVMAVMAAAALAAAGGVAVACWQIDQRIARQEERNGRLRAEIESLKHAAGEAKAVETERTRLLTRLEVIQSLQVRRATLPQVLDLLPRALPDELVLTALESSGERLTLKGYGRSDTAVSEFIRRLAGSGWLGEPSLTVIETQDLEGAPTRRFEIVVGGRHAGQEEAER